MHTEDEWNRDECYEGAQAGLQMQTFLDDWHYRVLHSGMAMEVDRIQAVEAALNLFEGHGIVMTPEEKERYAAMEEEDLIDAVVSKMGNESCRNFEHFALQLQLIVSTATRVRGALENDDTAEIVAIMEEGDQGITQHIMKRTAVEAGREILELRDVHEGWSRDMGSRLSRLSGLAETADKNRQELDRINAEIAAFHGRQNEKAKKAVMGMNSQSNQVLLKSVFGGWSASHIRFKGERHIHERFQAEILEAKAKLKETTGKSVSAVKRALMGNVDQSNQVLVGECLRRWAKDVKVEKKDREARDKLAADQLHYETLREGQRAAAKKNMMRMAGGNDEHMKSMIFSTWANHKAEVAKLQEMEEREETLQKQLQSMKSKSRGGSSGMMSRMSDATNQGLITVVWTAWKEETRSEKRARDLDATLKSQNSKFKSLNARQKENAKNVTQSAIELEEQNMLMNIFMNWATEVEITRIILHYSGKMQGKRAQLDQVHGMFKDFASALEQGISLTPRTEKGQRKSGAEKRPPAILGAA